MRNDLSVDKKEIEKFDKLANHWWDLDGEFKVLHQINPVRIEYIIDKMQGHFGGEAKSKSIIDIGCGGGIASCALYKEGLHNITAIDASKKNIEIAIAYAKSNNYNIEYLNATTTDLVQLNSKSSLKNEFKAEAAERTLVREHSQVLKNSPVKSFLNDAVEQGKKYDVILALEVIEHVANIDQFLSDVATLLKDNGMIIISTINRTLKALALAKIAAEYILRWAPIGTHEYNKFVKPSEINALITKHNLQINELKGLIYNLIHQNWELNQNIDVNYFAYISKISL